MELFLAVFSALVFAELFSRVLNFFEARRTERLFQAKLEQMKEMHNQISSSADKETQRILEALIKGEPLNNNEDGEWKYYDK